ncbi:MAG: hypothetical protein QNJ36_01630 [Calothrix sp. MO_167.B42]|nr:hypothetical protein [Calothrix sp. MO_167.B42]
MYRLVTAIIGFILTGSGTTIALLFPLSNIAILSFMIALGTSTLIYSLMGGLTDDEIELSADSEPIKNLVKLTANAKVAGPLVSFFLVLILMFISLIIVNNDRNKSINKINSILKSIKTSPEKGIIIDKDGNIHDILVLKYYPENQQNNPLEHRIKLTGKNTDGQIISDFLEKNRLIVEHKIKPNNEGVYFYVKDFHLSTLLGFFDRQNLKNVLGKLADSNSKIETTGTTLTEQIFSDCLNLTGVCKLPNTLKIKLSFNSTGDLPDDQAYTCSDSLILSRLKIIGSDNADITINRELGNILKSVVIKKLISYQGSNNCNQYPNLVQINGKFASDLYPTGADTINDAYITIKTKRSR